MPVVVAVCVYVLENVSFVLCMLKLNRVDCSMSPVIKQKNILVCKIEHINIKNSFLFIINHTNKSVIGLSVIKMTVVFSKTDDNI